MTRERFFEAAERFVSGLLFLLLLAGSACLAVWLLCAVYEHLGTAVTLATAALFVLIGWVFGFLHGRLLRLSETWKPSKIKMHKAEVFPFDRKQDKRNTHYYGKASDEIPF